VAGDSDFVSKMNKDKVSSYLDHEWRTKKLASIHLYRRISAFLRDRFPDIHVASEFEKELRIRRLVESGTFEATHRAIASLADYTEFSEQQAQDMMEAALENSQIHWISGDHDVKAFFTSVGRRFAHLLDDETRAGFEELFGEAEAEGGVNTDDIPF
jgi:hypothetical protein